jgi:predicted  nucleic acid-binding Zn-ribbon protein
MLLPSTPLLLLPSLPHLCSYCGKKFLPNKLPVHLRFFCGPDAHKSQALAKQQKKRKVAGQQQAAVAAAAEDEDEEEAEAVTTEEPEQEAEEQGGHWGVFQLWLCLVMIVRAAQQAAAEYTQVGVRPLGLCPVCGVLHGRYTEDEEVDEADAATKDKPEQDEEQGECWWLVNYVAPHDKVAKPWASVRCSMKGTRLLEHEDGLQYLHFFCKLSSPCESVIG